MSDRGSIQSQVTDIIAGLGGKEINYFYPCNTLNQVVVTYKYMQKPYSFVLSRLEMKVEEDELFNLVRRRFDDSIHSKYNSCQPTYTDPSIPTPMSSAT